MKTFNVLFCDPGEAMCSNVSAFFKNDEDFNVYTCLNADTFYRLTKSIVPDAVVIESDFECVKEICFSLGEVGTRPKVLLVGKQKREEVSSLLKGVEYDDLIFKPFSLLEMRAKLYTLIMAPGEKFKIVSTKSLDEKLSNIFIRAGIPPHIKGYQYLRAAVKLAINQPDIVNSITKKLYPSVAEAFSTSPSKVERAIRHAIEVAWNRGKIENLNSIFGIRIYSKGDKPTNGELIALVADKMVIEMMPD